MAFATVSCPVTKQSCAGISCNQGTCALNGEDTDISDEMRKALAYNAALDEADAQRELAHIEEQKQAAVRAYKLANLIHALEQIRDLEPRPSEHKLDWVAIGECEDCQSYKDHPVQRGICNVHRQPQWAREKQEAHEERILGYRAKTMARDALDAFSR